jgi:hypothetical protein
MSTPAYSGVYGGYAPTTTYGATRYAPTTTYGARYAAQTYDTYQGEMEEPQ